MSLGDENWGKWRIPEKPLGTPVVEYAVLSELSNFIGSSTVPWAYIALIAQSFTVTA
jgi:hypothetical protein